MGNCAQQEAVGEIAVRQKVEEKSVDILVARADDLKKTGSVRWFVRWCTDIIVHVTQSIR